MIFEIDNVLVQADIITEHFCCDLSQCKGQCCVEGDAGAPVTLDEIAGIEDALPQLLPHLSEKAKAVIGRQGVAYTDPEGDLVTSIVDGKDCVFTCHDNGCCLCAIEKALRAGQTGIQKPISCALYPIREKTLSNGMTALSYNRWSVCHTAVRKGRELQIPLYKFLEQPLRRRFSDEWYEQLKLTAEEWGKANVNDK